MSNLEHIFELALLAIEKGSSYEEWRDIMYSSNCAGNAKSICMMYRGRTPKVYDYITLSDGRTIWLSDIWELAQYTYPLTVMAKDSKEEK